MTKPLLVILSRDDELTRTLTEPLESQCEVIACPSVDEARRVFTEKTPVRLLADFDYPAAGGHTEVRFLDGVRASQPDMELVVLTGPLTPEPIERWAACAPVKHFQSPIDSAAVLEVLRPTTPSCTPEDSDGPRESISQKFETRTPELKKMLRELEVASRHNVTILLIGETGVGKTYLSRQIHRASPRRDEPFLPVACGALPSELIESELFGHVKGAFTSAHADKDGKFIAAGRGTILLDEIDVLGLEQQVKLLRVIETGEFEPVGSNQTHTSQARLVVASNLDLQPLVEAGRFRPDLYYRLNMLKFEIPPLRQRRPDIVPLAERFIRLHSERHGVTIRHTDSRLFDMLEQYPWPGNVRELENMLQRAVIFCEDGCLTVDHLPQHIVQGQVGPANDPTATIPPASMKTPSSLGQQVAVTEREIIEETLYKHNFSRTNTARALGISRVTLYNKMKKYGMTK